jgi:hypothetical protein
MAGMQLRIFWEPPLRAHIAAVLFDPAARATWLDCALFELKAVVALPLAMVTNASENASEPWIVVGEFVARFRRRSAACSVGGSIAGGGGRSVALDRGGGTGSRHAFRR